MEKDNNECKLQYNKQSVEEILVQRAVKTTIQILFDEGLFYVFPNADGVLKDFLLTTRRRTDLSEQVNVDPQCFVDKYNLKNKATSNVKIYQLLSSLSLSDVGIYLRNGPFSSDIGLVNLHQTKKSHWVAYINGKYFDSYGCAPPK